jgi:23S rRNA (cytidine1920-2'-O)/16S rRNA (cytidine1409-2'-O)-methyltransferase
VRRRLDAELVRRGLVPSRNQAAEVIRAGRVLVEGAPAATPAREVRDDEAIQVTGPPPRFVSRGGEKLAAALERFTIDVHGRRCLDAGASTGGFTDCLLQAGAAEVVAVDVGHGQLAWAMRTDRRVRVLEGRNLRELQPDEIGGPVSLAVADLSFISLRTVAPALARCTTDTAALVLLVKPQFEAGRPDIGKGGVVRDPLVHRRVLGEVSAELAATGLTPVAVVRSPLRGARGNVEFLLHCDRAATATLDPPLLDEVAKEAAMDS